MNSDVRLTIACGNYDRTRALWDGRVDVEGCNVTTLPMYPEEIFHRAFVSQEFDVCEMSFSSYIRTVADGSAPYIGIPAFVSRVFRHSGIYVRADSGIETPADLRGRRVGLPEYQITAVVWIRGMLQHEYGVLPSEIQWRQGGQEQAGRKERTPLKPIPGIDLQSIPDDRTLVDMLEAGDLDALFTARAPSSFLARKPHIRQLFPDARAVEQRYYEKTGLFPIMHLVGIRRSLVAEYPWLPASVYKAFCQAKALALADLHDINALKVTLPWVVSETRETEMRMGRDFWRYGVSESRHEIEALCQYAFEQGLTARKVEVGELFAPTTYDVSKV